MDACYVFDSSVYAKLLAPEEYSEKVEELFTKIIRQGGFLFVPSIFLYEVIAVFKKHGYDQTTIEEFLAEYYCNKPYIKLFSLEENIVHEALKICEKGTKKSGFPSFYDATYHALAMWHSCDFITADKKYYEKAKQFGNIRLLDSLNTNNF